MWGDVLENLKPSDLRITPGLATLRRGVGAAEHIMLSQDAPTNQQILDATKRFYGQNQRLVDTTTQNTNNVADSQKNYVGLLNSHNWQNKQLTQSEQDQTSTGIFGGTGGSGGGGIFGPTLDNVKASQLFTTISVGVSAEVIVFVGGLGGLGCAWDIAKREGPKGYGYATAELGFKIAADINVQACIFNKMPHELNMDIFGLTVSVYYGLGATFAVFFTGKDTVVLGYSIAIGAGLGGGAAVFGGHIWSFG
jgi:hypothetical protein